MGELDSQSSWQPLANATAVVAEQASLALQGNGAQGITGGRDGLIVEDRMGWKTVAQGGHQSGRRNRCAIPALLRALFLTHTFLLLLRCHGSATLRPLLPCGIRH